MFFVANAGATPLRVFRQAAECVGCDSKFRRPGVSCAARTAWFGAPQCIQKCLPARDGCGRGAPARDPTRTMSMPL